jgi:hypothetical protein
MANFIIFCYHSRYDEDVFSNVVKKINNAKCCHYFKESSPATLLNHPNIEIVNFLPKYNFENLIFLVVDEIPPADKFDLTKIKYSISFNSDKFQDDVNLYSPLLSMQEICAILSDTTPNIDIPAGSQIDFKGILKQIVTKNKLDVEAFDSNLYLEYYVKDFLKSHEQLYSTSEYNSLAFSEKSARLQYDRRIENLTRTYFNYENLTKDNKTMLSSKFEQVENVTFPNLTAKFKLNITKDGFDITEITQDKSVPNDDESIV